MSSTSFTAGEIRSVAGLCSVFFLRMLGLFLVLPVLSPHAGSLHGAKPILIGLAVGAFPLTQTILQVPFGWISDQVGRKPVIVAGLLMFALGSFVAAWATTIFGLIGGLALQGAGAIGSVVVALIGDLTRDSVRTRAMAMIGGTVGLALGIGFIGGPLIASVWNVPALFVVIAVLSLIAIPALIYLVPNGDPDSLGNDETVLQVGRLLDVLSNRDLWRMNVGIFTANASLRSLFVVIPFLLTAVISPQYEWLVYAVVLLISGVVMFPTIFLAERRGLIQFVLFGSIGFIVIGLLLFPIGYVYLSGLLISLTLYFIGFSLIEAILPSQVTRLAGESERGTAMGVFNMMQYLGAFVGSMYGGIFLQSGASGAKPFGIPVMIAGLLLLFVLWALFIASGTLQKGGFRRS